MQDAAREQARRKVRRRHAAGIYERGTPDWRYRLWASYDAAQGWVVVTLVGAAIGLNAAVLSIVTEWLSDIKMGYCTTGFYLNESFCCWGEDSGKLYTTLLSCVPDSLTDKLSRLRRVAPLDRLRASQLLHLHRIRGRRPFPAQHSNVRRLTWLARLYSLW